MAEIKLIDETTDLSNLKRPIGWDLVVHGQPYDVYQVAGYCHTIGGRYANNDYWACPMGEVPTYLNLIGFNGDAPTWGITFDRNNYSKHKWGESSVEVNGQCWITRNGEKFYQIPARNLDYGIAKAQYCLVKLLEECPLDICSRNWKEKAVGQKIWYENQPAIIQSVNQDNDLWIIPDPSIGSFKAPIYYTDEYETENWEEDYGEGLKTDLLSPNISWFRN